MSNRAPILARLRNATAALFGGAQAAGRLLFGSMLTGSANDFRARFWAHRRMTPAEVRVILEQATFGSTDAQWELFAMMEDTWPRLSKNLNELRRAASRSTFSVNPYSPRDKKPTASALDRAAFVDGAIRQWWPRPGTMELSFEDTLYHALDAVGKGVSVLEIHWQRDATGLVPRCAHVLAPQLYGWNSDGTELGLRLMNNEQWKMYNGQTAAGAAAPHSTLSILHSTLARSAWRPFPQDHFLVGIWNARTGAPGATAMLRALAPYWCGITFGWEWLMSNAQIFGVPFRWATYARDNPDSGRQLRDMLDAMGQSGYAAFPDGTKMEFKEVSQNVTGNPQVVIQEMADKACDLLILGQELSGGAHATGLGSGSANLQGNVRQDRIREAAQWCADLLNYQLVPALLRVNYGDVTEPPLVVPDTDEEHDALKEAQRDKVLLDSGMVLPRDWYYQRHNVPVPLDDEEVIGGKPAPPPPDKTDKTDPPPQLEPPEEKPVAAKTFSTDELSAMAREVAARAVIKAAAATVHEFATAALYKARALSLLNEAERAALSPLVDALAWLETAPEEHAQTALKNFQAVLDKHAPRILADPALAAAWETVIAPPAAEGAAQTIKP